LMASHIRQFAKEVFWQIHHLKLQYGPDQITVPGKTLEGQPEKLQISKNILALDYDFGIAGEGGPLDKQNRLNQVMMMYGMLMQNPIVGQNLMHVYSVTRLVLEALGVSDIETLIGTPDDIQKMQQAQQQQAQQQQQLQMMLAQHGVSTPKMPNVHPAHSGGQRSGHAGAVKAL
ncbi:MAG: portal protein, partial [Candidatus Dormibacteria bacterium]